MTIISERKEKTSKLFDIILIDETILCLHGDAKQFGQIGLLKHFSHESLERDRRSCKDKTLKRVNLTSLAIW